MKKILALAIAPILCACLAACGAQSDTPSATTTPVTTAAAPQPRSVPVQYVRTNGSYDEQGKLVVIESKARLDAYYAQNRREGEEDYTPDTYDFDYGWDESKSFAEAMDKYDEAFFEDNLLVLVILVEPSGSNRHEVTGVRGNTIQVRRIVPEVGTADMATWHLMVEMARADYGGGAFELEIETPNREETTEIEE